MSLSLSPRAMHTLYRACRIYGRNSRRMSAFYTVQAWLRNVRATIRKRAEEQR
jgi:hypothetical protein